MTKRKVRPSPWMPILRWVGGIALLIGMGMGGFLFGASLQSDPVEPDPTATAFPPTLPPRMTSTPVPITVTDFCPVYRVFEGDTLTSIAEKRSVTVQDMMRINGMQDPANLNTGDLLKIPVLGCDASEQLPQPTPPDPCPDGRTCLDMVFVIDSTGSMSDEIDELRSNMIYIAGQIDALEADVLVRYGMVAYRDRGDAYVTQAASFTENVASLQAALDNLRAGGGGDNPEALTQGLNEALHRLHWRGENTIKLAFVVGDAPAQIRDAGENYITEATEALRRGVKIHTVASSGLNPVGEFMFRQIAQITTGRFVFLTYEQGVVGGAPGEERPDLSVGEPEDEDGIGEYTVDQLDELIIKLIRDEIALREGQ